MKQIKNIQELSNSISRKSDFFRESNGKKYEISFITILNMSLINTFKMINEGSLYVSEEM